MIKNRLDSKYASLAAELKIDCKNCSGLCCVALYCMKTDGFPADKEAGTPCKHLISDYRCEIHSKLATKKMRGCLAYDCFGAGQKTTQIYHPIGTWKTNPEQADEIFKAFTIVFKLHHMLWYLVEAFSLTSNEQLKSTIEALIFENEQMIGHLPSDISQASVETYRLKVNEVLKQISSTISVDAADKIRNTDYFGKDLKGENLDGRDFSMSLMIAANLEGCSLKRTNFLGADMRDTNLKNTDLSECIFLTQMQINSARGNSNTKIPLNLTRPTTWQEI